MGSGPLRTTAALAARLGERTLTPAEVLGLVAAKVSRKPVTVRVEGVTFEVEDPQTLSLIVDIFVRRVYTPPGFEIGPGDVVVDVGAHRGVFSAYAARRTRTRVLAFEPEPENYRRLARMVEVNGLGRIQPRQGAVGGERRRSTLYSPGPSTRASLMERDPLTQEAGSEVATVQVHSLKEILEPLDEVGFLKLDCEGGEFEILTGTPDAAWRRVRRLVMEIHGERESERVRRALAGLERVFPQSWAVWNARQPLGLVFAAR